MVKSIRKVLIVSDTYETQVNGVSIMLNNLKMDLEDLGICKVEILDIRKFNTFSLPFYKSIRIPLTRKGSLAKKIKEIEFDSLHILTEGVLGFHTRRIAAENKWKYTTHYCTMFPELLNLYTKLPKSFFYRYFKWFHKNSTYTLTPSKGIERNLKFLIPNLRYVPISAGKKIYTAKEASPFTNDSSPIILFVGRISKEKNVEAFCNVPFAGTKVAIGDGPLLKKLKRKYSEVKFIGGVPHESLYKYYAAADVLIFPSYLDTFGKVITEAQSHGLPVAALEESFGAQDAIIEGKNGSLSKPLKNAIKNALNCTNVKVLNTYDKNSCTHSFYNSLVRIC